LAIFFIFAIFHSVIVIKLAHRTSKSFSVSSMGKNQTHKSMQRSRGPEDGAPETGVQEEGADVSFHTAEWHAARYTLKGFASILRVAEAQ
jgi:hypothetical protein